jgi:radical SAM superfamily enzyme YgiQ (UPF0313 family)
MNRMSGYSAWYETRGHRLTGGGVWLRGCGWNVLPPSAMESRPFRLLVCRLSSYYDAVDSWTHRLLYAIAASDPRTFPDLAFLPPPADLPVFKRDGVPWWLAVSSKLGAADFHCLAVSNACVQELINLPALLRGSGIPLSKQERMARPDLPMVLLGGANAMHTSAIWRDDPPVDGIFVGNGPERVREVFRLCREGRERGLPKEAILDSLQSVDGFILPDRPRKTRVARPSGKSKWIPADAPVLPGESQAGSAPLWISSGCPSSCSFCAESWAAKPYREFPADELTAEMAGLKAGMGLSQIELAAFNFNGHSRLFDLLLAAAGRFGRVRLKSQRFDRFAADPGLAACLHAVGKTQVTCGLEGISGRLRRYLNKQIDDDRLFSALAEMHKVPLRSLKIFLIATGLETDEDLEEFESVLDRIRSIQEKAGRGPGVLLSVTPLVRFPWTPLEFEEAPSMETAADAVNRIVRAARQKGFECRESAPVWEYWFSQVLVRATDGRNWDALVAAVTDTKRLYFRTVNERLVSEFRKNLAASGMDPDSLLAGTSAAEGRKKPWRNIETGVSYKTLLARCERSRLFIETAPCCREEAPDDSCGKCAACPDSPALSSRRIRPAQVAELTAVKEAMAGSTVEIRLSVSVGRMFRGVDRGLLASAVSSSLMRTDRSLVPHYLGFSGSFWQSRENPAWLRGEDILVLLWREDGLPILRNFLTDADRLSEVNRLLGENGRLTGECAREPASFRFVFRSGFPFEPGDYLRARGLAGVRTGPSDGNQSYGFSGPSLKKKILETLTVTRPGDGYWAVELKAGPKFSAGDFLKSAFHLPDRSDWMAIDAECVGVE